MGGGLEIVGCACALRSTRFFMLVVMSRCLDESRSCSGVGLGGRFMSDVSSIVCHLVSIGVVRGSWVEELCVRIFRCLRDSACRSLRKQRSLFRRVLGFY